MSINTVNLQGRFRATGSDIRLNIPSDIDHMWVYNETQIGLTADIGVKYYWQRGMADGTGLRWFKSGGGNNLNIDVLASPNGFQLLDETGEPLALRVAVTAGTNAAQPVISTGSTAGLGTGSIVRLSADAGTTAPDLNGVDFEIDNVVNNVSFRIRQALADAPGAVYGTGFYRRVLFDPIFYPRSRFIADISQAAQGVVTTTVQHGYLVGQIIRFTVPAVAGTNAPSMTQLDGLEATIVAVPSVSTFTINIDTSAFNAYAWPLALNFTAVTWGKVNPVGQDTAQSLTSGVDILSDATLNVAIRGMLLPTGTNSPGGAGTDTMYWVAGRSEQVDND